MKNWWKMIMSFFACSVVLLSCTLSPAYAEPSIAAAIVQIGVADVIGFALENWASLSTAVKVGLVTVILLLLAPHIAAITPTRKDDLWIEQNGTIMQKLIRGLWNLVAGNYGNAKNTS